MTFLTSHQGGVFQPGVGLWQNILEVRVFAIDGSHGVVDGLSSMCPFGFLKEFVETCGFGKEENAFGLIV